ncbi:hypothetical protein BDB01DRAFT_797139 [Pilobolus umbonatus]|nr:hypothetical protein BDB01DRAFT_797139 [Pilobolus umbonatus]
MTVDPIDNSFNEMDVQLFPIINTTTTVDGNNKIVHYYTCPYCTQLFTRKYNLRSHLNTHNTIKPYKCDKCYFTFKRQHDLKRHQMVHSDKRPFICSACNRSFFRLDTLKRHHGSTTCRAHKHNLLPWNTKPTTKTKVTHLESMQSTNVFQSCSIAKNPPISQLGISTNASFSSINKHHTQTLSTQNVIDTNNRLEASDKLHPHSNLFNRDPFKMFSVSNQHRLLPLSPGPSFSSPLPFNKNTMVSMDEISQLKARVEMLERENRLLRSVILKNPTLQKAEYQLLYYDLLKKEKKSTNFHQLIRNDSKF